MLKKTKFVVYVLLILVAALINAAYAFDCNDNAFYADRDVGDDANEGTQLAPFATIQKLVDVLGECIDTDTDVEAKTGYVFATSTPYTETSRKSGLDFGGVTFTKGGNSESERIYLIGLPNNGLSHPVIDQQLLYSDDNDGPLTGFFVARDGTDPASYITISNFEIMHTTNSGVLMDTAGNNGDNIDIVVEHNYIHHLYGGDNIGGVRLDFCDACIVRNNVIHDVYQTREESTSNILNSRPFGLHSGVHGYQPANCIIENNLIFNVGRGVFQKQASEEGMASNTVRRNIFYNTTVAAYSLEIQGAGLASPQNANFYENIVVDSSSAISTSLSGTAGPFGQGDDLNIYNNTVINTQIFAAIQGVTNIRFFNNIRVGTEPYWSNSGTTIDFATVRDNDHDNSIIYFDYNFYSNHAALWILERYEENAAIFESNSEWQNAGGNTGLATNPDSHAVFSSESVNTIFNRSNDALDLHQYVLSAGHIALTGGCGADCPVEDYPLIGAVAEVNGEDQMLGPSGSIIGPIFDGLEIKIPYAISSLTIQE